MSDLRAIVEHARERWNAGDLAGYLSLYADDIRLHGYAPEPLDKGAVNGFYETIWQSLTAPGTPSPRLEFHEVLVDGDLYCCRFTMSGVQTGEFNGVPASGRPYALEGITIMRFADGRAVERWSTADFLGLMVQLGALPASAA